MSRTVNMHEAKTQLSRLVKEVAAGGEVVIAKSGEPVAKLVPYEHARRKREPGGWEGNVWIAPDFDELPADVAEAFGAND